MMRELDLNYNGTTITPAFEEDKVLINDDDNHGLTATAKGGQSFFIYR